MMNTAIEADDTNARLRDRARQSMTLWHRLVGRIVKDGKAARNARADLDPYALASIFTASLEGALMLARLYDDPATHGSRRRPPRRARRVPCRAVLGTGRMRPSNIASHSGRGRALAHRSRWTDPARVRFRVRGLDGYERLGAIQRGELSPPPAAALLGLALDELDRGRTVFSMVADELHENPMGTMHGGVVATFVDTAMGCAVSSTLPADAGFTTLELSTNFVRAITQSTGRVYAEGRGRPRRRTRS